ncbi:MAG: DUF4233 domain-containing protein [Nocardioidaceae bacterium]|nr:DUF4233 domain-containing protein [Nocardioidaceae bacterium]
MRGICAAMLVFEAVVIALATPVMIAVEDVQTDVALSVGLGLAFLALLTAGLLRRPWAYVLGHAIQVAIIAMGFLVPAMFLVGVMFAALWVTAYLLGRKIEADKAVR